MTQSDTSTELKFIKFRLCIPQSLPASHPEWILWGRHGWKKDHAHQCNQEQVCQQKSHHGWRQRCYIVSINHIKDANGCIMASIVVWIALLHREHQWQRKRCISIRYAPVHRYIKNIDDIGRKMHLSSWRKCIIGISATLRASMTSNKRNGLRTSTSSSERPWAMSMTITSRGGVNREVLLRDIWSPPPRREVHTSCIGFKGCLGGERATQGCRLPLFSLSTVVMIM